MKENNFPIPCVLAPEYDCGRECERFGMSAVIFARGRARFKTTPEEARQILIDDTKIAVNRVLYDQTRLGLSLSGELSSCSFFNGC